VTSEPGYAVLRLATQLVDAVQNGVTAAGFADIRPSHGFALARISQGGATVVDVADALGVTKQAASQLVAGLVERGHVRRRPHPDDARAWLLALTPRGRAVTRAADAAVVDAVAGWRRELGSAGAAGFERSLAALVRPGPLRPTA
jgi:DNA-binding MarR family transcriptional regulator